ncbi:type II toxin-antitoxin system antitoxin SocA domain-containing protein [Hyphomonas sp.]|uniref:Panacea domain-containing protein n=1 Tax=Alphaproteobacteria TaxID=28211 RepID=UPI0032663BF9
MAIGALTAARELGAAADWRLSNLALQKILYLAHMFHLGRHSEPLIHEHFEAWDYGPVVPEVYRRARAFGSGPVQDAFYDVPWARLGSEKEIIQEAAASLKDVSPSRLVAITHSPGGAWAEHYLPGWKGSVIPNRDILAEYERLHDGKAA